MTLCDFDVIIILGEQDRPQSEGSRHTDPGKRTVKCRRAPVSNVNVSIYAQLDIDLPSKTGKLEKRTPSTRGVTGDAGTAPERLVPSDGATGWERG